jgi:hypothetical protein
MIDYAMAEKYKTALRIRKRIRSKIEITSKMKNDATLETGSFSYSCSYS